MENLRENYRAGSSNRKEFDSILQSMFPEQDFSEGGKHSKKAKITFQVMIDENWTVEQFRETMRKFIYTHKSTFWMPNDIFTIKNRLYPEPEISL